MSSRLWQRTNARSTLRSLRAIDLPQCRLRGETALLPRISQSSRGQSKMITRAAIILLLGTSVGLAEESAPSPLEQQGRALAEQMCSECHAIGKSGQSPHVNAPAFRALDRRLDLDGFMDRLREGLMVGHPDMPMFRFTREDARAFVLYLRSIQAP
jgi:mono/diheme cytochrome c family protein